MTASAHATAERAARCYGYMLARRLRRFSPHEVAHLTKVFLEAFIEALYRNDKLTIGQILAIATIPMDLAMKLQKTSNPSEVSEEVKTNA